MAQLMGPPVVNAQPQRLQQVEEEKKAPFFAAQPVPHNDDVNKFLGLVEIFSPTVYVIIII